MVRLYGEFSYNGLWRGVTSQEELDSTVNFLRNKSIRSRHRLAQDYRFIEDDGDVHFYVLLVSFFYLGEFNVVDENQLRLFE